MAVDFGSVRRAAAPAGEAAGQPGLWRRLAFAGPAFPLSAMLLPVLIYLPDHYARNLGMDLVVLASVLMAVRIFDLWFDPVLGFVIDKTNTPIGRYRPWFVASLPISVVSIWMLFMAPVGMTGFYLLFWLIAANVGQSMGQLSHMAWAAASAPTYDQRSRIYGWLLALSIFGTFAIMATPPFSRMVLGIDHSRGVEAMGWLVVAVLPVTFLVALAATREPPTPPAAAKPNLRQYLDMLRRGRVLRVLVTDITWGTAPALAATLFFVYMDAIKGIPREVSSLILLVYFVGGMVGAPVWTRLARTVSKHKAMMFAGLTYAVFQSAMMLAPADAPLVVAGFMFLAGLASTAGQILLRSMMADVADEERLHSGVERTGLLFSLLTGSVKIGSTLAIGIGLYTLKVFDFDFAKGSANPQDSLVALGILYALVPAGLGVATALVIRGHKIDAAAHAEIRRQLDLRDAQLRGEAG
ncbi:MFS transporter [Phenylobacterium sp. SCN 70-31]|uniref:MFS transporter n=1 Tax=Phenylobacterium sp. SCN 70-31 TaxID=1660129 RepID=UPI0025D9A365|nr:MFS transporter [Phenylobacterium sp. SCN 70-31]